MKSTFIFYSSWSRHVWEYIANIFIIQYTRPLFSLFFDKTPETKAEVKLNSYWEKNEKGEEVILIANYGELKINVNKIFFEHVGRSNRSDSILLRYYWKADPNDKNIINTRKDVWFNNKKANVRQLVRIFIRYDYPHSKNRIPGSPKLIYSPNSPPSSIYQMERKFPQVGSDQEYYFKYNKKEYFILCTNETSCRLRIGFPGWKITLYAKFGGLAFFYWDTFSKELFQILDQIIIEPGEVEYQINNTGN